MPKRYIIGNERSILLVQLFLVQYPHTENDDWRQKPMIYRKFKDLELSALGMGAMRLPVICGKDGMIDEAAAGKMVAYAMEKASTTMTQPEATTKDSPSWSWESC